MLLWFFIIYLGGFAGSLWLCRLFCRCSVQTSHCGGFSCWRAKALGCLGFSSCSSWAKAQLLRCISLVAPWHPGSEIKPVSCIGRQILDQSHQGSSCGYFIISFRFHHTPPNHFTNKELKHRGVGIMISTQI